MSNKETTFGQRLRQLRKSKNLTQREMADKVAAHLRAEEGHGFDFTYLSKIENSRTGPPSRRTIEQIARVLETDPDELIALAGKVPAGFGETLKKSTETARAFYRSAFDADLTDEDWQELLKDLKRRKEARENSSKPEN